MPYFITRKVFLFPSFDLEEKERENIKTPSMKWLAKKGRRINLEIYKNDK